MEYLDRTFADKPEITDGVYLERYGDWVHTNVPHHVMKHSPDGFLWGYGGSGPADLALNIIEAVLLARGYEGARREGCFELTTRLYQKFKVDFIVTMPYEGGHIPFETIAEWIDGGA